MTEDVAAYGGEPVRPKDRVQHAAVKLALGLLGLVVTRVVLLVFDVVTTRGAALAAAVVVALAVLVAWLAVPKGLARRHG